MPDRVKLRVLSAVIAFLTTVLLWSIFSPERTQQVEYSVFSDSANDFSSRHVIVTNVKPGSWDGRYYTIPSRIQSQHPTVFAMTSLPQEHRIDKIIGYSYGVMEFSVEGCPTRPPFLYVISAREFHR